MKKNRIIIFILFLAIFGCSKDILDRKPLDVMTEEVVWKDPALINAYLNGIYADMPFLLNDAVDWGNWQWIVREFTDMHLSDECRNRGWAPDPNFKLGLLQAEGGCLEWWGYPTIRKANDFIERVTASTVVADAVKKQKVAEARFLRAFAYFTIVKRYGGVPLITKAQKATDTEEELYRKREKEEVIYNFIITELDAITADLPATYTATDYGRASKYAALALKSRAAMYAASISQWGKVQIDGVVGIPANKTQSLWQASYDASKAIIDSHVFALYNKYPTDKAKNYQMIWLDERNIETILAKPYTGNGGVANNWEFCQVPRTKHPWGSGQISLPYLEMIESYDNIDGSSGKLDRALLTSKLWTLDELWGNKDPRFKGSIYTQGTPWMGKNLDFYRGIQDESGTIITTGAYQGLPWSGTDGTSAGSPFGVLKFLDPTTVAQWWDFGATDWIVFRYGEILLNFAEASFELNKPAEALDAVNQIRVRAGIAPLTSITREAIRHERKVELAFELNRYWDLRRWRTAVTDLTRDFTSFNYVLDYPTRKFKIQLIEKIDGASAPPVFFEKNYYFPITPNRIANNKNLVENPGY